MTFTKTVATSLTLAAWLSASAAIAAGGLDAGKKRLTANLTGAAEVPGPGDVDGKGKAILELDPANDRLCVKLRVEGIDAATMAHVHVGVVGSAGDAVVKLDPPTKGSSTSCKQIPPEVTAGLLKTPANYYVNVHNDAFPNGAIRGQLGK